MTEGKKPELWTDAWGNECADPEPCPDCGGSGRDYDETCFRCGGEGKLCMQMWPHGPIGRPGDTA